ncbi:hypothetical protein PMI26_05818 [Pseudomonas sp. GM33]|nr:hypothetical protein PMI26_05818 [Pseudomonas sp. GM33]
MLRLVKLFFIPVAFFNALGGVVSIIWLVTLGEWRQVGLGLLLLFTLGFMMAKLLAPEKLIPYAAVSPNKKSRLRLYLLGGGHSLVMTVWCWFVLIFFAKHYASESAVPMLIWSYTVAFSTICYRQEGVIKSCGWHAFLPVVCTQISYLAAIAMIYFTDSSLFSALVMILVGSTFGVCLLVNSPLNQPPEEYMVD